MFGQFPRYTCIRKQEIHSRKNRAVSAEALLQQLLLLLLVTLPFPSFTTNTITGMLMKTPTTSQWTLDTTFQMCHLQMGLFRSGPGHQVHFYNENNNVTMTTRASWYLWSILSIDEDAQTISLDATIRFQWNSTYLEGHDFTFFVTR